MAGPGAPDDRATPGPGLDLPGGGHRGRRGGLRAADGVVWRFPAVAAIVAGAVVLVAGVVADLVRQRPTHPGDDPVVAPLAPATGTASGQALARTLGRLVTWQVPMATAALLATTWWMTG